MEILLHADIARIRHGGYGAAVAAVSAELHATRYAVCRRSCLLRCAPYTPAACGTASALPPFFSRVRESARHHAGTAIIRLRVTMTASHYVITCCRVCYYRKYATVGRRYASDRLLPT